MQQFKLLKSSLRRAIRWEFWPMWLFYIPIVIFIIALFFRFRGLTFLSANPGFKLGGVIGDNKSNALNQLQENQPENTAQFLSLGEITEELTNEERIVLANNFMKTHSLSFPVVLKPNKGQRGSDVSVIRSSDELESYLQANESEILIQKHISGEEFGVFYYRDPQSGVGQILSITHKCFPQLTGDGRSSLSELILNDDRTNYMARYLLELHKDKLDLVLAENEKFTTVEIGSHCRGSLFLDGNQYGSEALREIISKLSDSVEGFHFGRYDIRVPSINDLSNGENIQVLELNGVTSESTHIYDPEHSVFYAYKSLFKQWFLAFKVGQQNIQNNHAEKINLKSFFQYVFIEEVSWR